MAKKRRGLGCLTVIVLLLGIGYLGNSKSQENTTSVTSTSITSENTSSTSSIDANSQNSQA